MFLIRFALNVFITTCLTLMFVTHFIPTHIPTECLEDMPCWDCETMGNGICGLTPSENFSELQEATK